MNDIQVTGDEPLADGMRVCVRIRRDFTVTDAARLLAVARAAYRELNPGVAADQVAEHVTGAADAIFTILERAGIHGDPADLALESYAAEGLGPGGQLAQVSFDDPVYLEPGHRCPPGGDPFALPSQR